jgi:hypothetical protein
MSSYGDTFRPAGAERDIKVRGPVWAGIFSLVTLGIYTIYWIYVTAKDLSAYGRAKGRDLGQSPAMTLLAVTIGWIIIVPALVAIYRQARRIQQAQRLAGVDTMNGWIALVLYLVFSPVFFAYEQSELNKAWAAEGGPVPKGHGYEAPPLPSAERSPQAEQPLARGTPTPTSRSGRCSGSPRSSRPGRSARSRAGCSAAPSRSTSCSPTIRSRRRRGTSRWWPATTTRRWRGCGRPGTTSRRGRSTGARLVPSSARPAGTASR